MSGNSSNKKRHHHKQQRRQQQTGNSDGKTCDVKTKEENRLEHEDDSDVVKLFKQYATKLDDKQDRYERIVHISRDITIESKRVIFLLHQVNLNDMLDVKYSKILNDAEVRLNDLIKTKFKTIANELKDVDPYLYLRAYTSGLQEFTEALLFHHYIKEDSLLSYDTIKSMFRYGDSVVETNDECKEQGTEVNERTNEEVLQEKKDENEDLMKVQNLPQQECTPSNIELPEVIKAGQSDNINSLELLYPHVDYVLGMADFTGELMRMCINGLGSGKLEQCFKLCNYVKDLLIGYLSLNSVGFRELNRKLNVLKHSLNKMEYVCYNIRVRGSEVPKHMLVNVIETNNQTIDDNNQNEDEGFY